MNSDRYTKNIVVVRIAYCNHWHIAELMKIFRKYCSRQFTTVSWHFAKRIGTSTCFICCCPIHTNAFSLSSKRHRLIRVHATVFMPSRLSTKRYRIARWDASWTLCACYNHTRLRYFRSFFSFDAFSTVYTNTIWMRFRLDPLSFTNVFKSFLMKTLSVLVRTEGLNASNCMRISERGA